MTMRFSRWMHYAVATAAMMAANGAGAAVLVDQPYDDLGHVWSSQHSTTNAGYLTTAYENFSLATAATITSASFTGMFYAGPTGDFPYGAIKGITTTFYANDASNLPGTVLQSFYSAGAPGETFIANTVSAISGNLGSVYSYTLPVSFTALAGTDYWISFVADLDYAPAFGITTSSVGDGTSYRDPGLGGASREVLRTDLAIRLEGTTAAVPEPATWAMMLVGMGAVGSVLRRRRRVERASLLTPASL